MFTRALRSLVKKQLSPAQFHKCTTAAQSCAGVHLFHLPLANIHTQSMKLNEFQLPDFNYITDAPMAEKIQNFDVIANEGHKNYLLFATYVELLAGYLYPFVSKWVTQGLETAVSSAKEADPQFVDFIMDQWGMNAVALKPLPPRQHDDYIQDQYRIRVIAEKSLVKNQTYNFIYKSTKESAMPLMTLIKCIENYPWKWRLGVEGQQSYEPLMPLFHNSTRFFKYAITTYISHNSNNFTIDHDVIGRFWFHQDCLFKCLHHFSRLSNGVIEFPLGPEVVEYLWTLRSASLERDGVINELLCDPASDYARFMKNR